MIEYTLPTHKFQRKTSIKLKSMSGNCLPILKKKWSSPWPAQKSTTNQCSAQYLKAKSSYLAESYFLNLVTMSLTRRARNTFLSRSACKPPSNRKIPPSKLVIERNCCSIFSTSELEPTAVPDTSTCKQPTATHKISFKSLSSNGIHLKETLNLF